MIHAADFLNSFVYNGWVEDVGTWVFGLICGAWWTHRKLVKPLRSLHEKHDALHTKVDALNGSVDMQDPVA